jgi:hypothetical protein
MSHTSRMLTPNPEGDPQEEAELTATLQEAMHEFHAGPNGKCDVPSKKYCYEHKVTDYHNPCGGASYSVLHYSEQSYDDEDY